MNDSQPKCPSISEVTNGDESYRRDLTRVKEERLRFGHRRRFSICKLNKHEGES